MKHLRIIDVNKSDIFKRKKRCKMSVYKLFPQANLIKEWDKLLKLSREEVVALYEEWKVIEKENKEKNTQVLNEKSDKLTEVTSYLKSVGIDVYKYRTKGFFKEKSGYQSWFQKNIADEISKKYPYYRNSLPYAHMSEVIVDGVRLWNNQSPTTIVELYDRITQQYKSKIREVNKNDKLLVKSIEYAAKHEIDIEDLNPKQIIDYVADIAKDNYLKEELPDGTEVYLKHACDECSTYIMGERRCSCGNRRISIEVEGDIIEGFYYYPEPY
jgi:hypothetical protein